MSIRMYPMYSQWDKWASDYDEDGNLKSDMQSMSDNIKCEIGKPLTEEEFKKARQGGEKVIQYNSVKK